LFSLFSPLLEIDELIRRWEELLLLPVEIFSKKWNSLSGGERQRAVIICGLTLALSMTFNKKTNYLRKILQNNQTDMDVESRQTTRKVDDEEGEMNPCILLLDEPTAACDQQTTLVMEQVLIETRLTTIIITHHESQAQRIANRRIILR
jgi:ABC-type iron transport system FetAB ATPase subunit